MTNPALVSDPLVLASEHDQTTGAFAGLSSTDHAAHSKILDRAYAIWESEGHPVDRELSNWLQAEAGILGER
jgi:hypothetical protein